MKNFLIILFLFFTQSIYSISIPINKQNSNTISNPDSLIKILKNQITTWNKIDDNFRSIRKLLDSIPLSSTKELSPTLDNILYFYYAIDSNYTNSDRLYKLKYQIQDSIEALAISKLAKFNVVGLKASVYIKNTGDLVNNERKLPQFEYIIYVNLFHDFEKYRQIKTREGKEKFENDVRENIKYARNVLLNTFKIDTANIIIRQGSSVTAFKDRFSSNINTPVEYNFWYLLEIWGARAKLYPQTNDIKLLKSIERNDFITYKNQHDMDIDRTRLSRLINELELLVNKK